MGGCFLLKRKLFVILVSTLLLSSSFLSNVSVIYAAQNISEETSGYFLIDYNGEEQEVTIEDNITLLLTGWTDDSKSSVEGIIEYKTDSVNTTTQHITLNVSDEINKLDLSNNNSISYRIIETDTFKAEFVVPQQLQDQVLIVEQNENGTSKEEVKTVDEFGTIIDHQGYTYYTTEEYSNKKSITEEEYNSLNSGVSSSDEDGLSQDKDNSSTSEQTISILSTSENPSVSYSTHVQSYGWQNYVKNGESSGTTGKAKRLEAIKIKLENAPYTGGISYTTHVQSYGWMNNVSNDKPSGTTGESKRLEAIKISLTGEMAEHYDIYYRVYAQSYGWLDWAKNGEPAGTQGISKRLEAIEIKLIKKGGAAPEATNVPFVTNLSVSYSTHVQTYGWLNYVKDSKTSGTEGQSKRLEAIKIKLENAPFSGGISYKTHVQSYGWLNSVTNGAISGKTGEAKRLEAIQINLTGEMAKYYDVYYRVHAQSYGWLDWAKNGESAGTEGLGKRLEAIQIVLVKKGGPAPGQTETPFISKPSVVYSSYVQTYGWLGNVSNGSTSGTTGQSKRLEAIKVSLQNTQYSGGVSYKTHVQSYGWLDSVSNGKMSGTTNEGKRVEAIQLSLTGEIAQHYDIYYRVYAQSFGWLGWAKNGQSSGTEGLSKRVEAIQIVLIEKGGKAPGSTAKSFLTNPSITYRTHVQEGNWSETVKDGQTSGTIDQNKILEAVQISLKNSPYSGNVSYKTYVQSHGWLDTVTNGQTSGTIGNGKRLEAIQISLTGTLANYYDIYYRVYVDSYGWLGWAKNGMRAGTSGLSKPVEAIEIKLVAKGTGSAVSESESFKSKIISTTSYNLTLNDAVNLQMKVDPQTDNDYAYVSKTYVKDGKVNGVESGSKLNVRSGPGTSYDKVGELQNGESVKILAEVNGWYAIEFNHSTWVIATPADVGYYLNPSNFAEGTTEYFQFLKLSNTANLDANEINTKILNGKGILSGKADAFITAGKKYNVNEVYLISHALLETGQGNSNLSNGKIKVGQLYYDSETDAGKWVTFLPSGVIYVAEYKDFDTSDKDTTKTWKYTKESSFDNSQATNIRTIYNMYGIDAVDSAPEIRGSIKAYREGWFDPNTAIIEGASTLR